MDNSFNKELLGALKELNNKIGQALQDIGSKRRIEDYSRITDKQLDEVSKAINKIYGIDNSKDKQNFFNFLQWWRAENERDNKNNGGDSMKNLEIGNKENLEEGYLGEIDKIDIYIDENGKVLSSELTSEQLSNAKEICEMKPKSRTQDKVILSTQVTEKDNFVSPDKVCFAKVRPTAKIPSKNIEDGGYDIYADFEDDYMVILPHETKMIPTGIASAFSSDYVMVGRERGSTGTKGMALRSGVIDSGYRGEWFIPITNTNDRPIVIGKKGFEKYLYNNCVINVDKNNNVSTIDIDGTIVYPYEKGICQALLLPVPKVEIKEISYEALQSIPSRRGTGALGSSGK